VFKNETPRRVSVVMGFPESSYGDVDTKAAHLKTRFLRFATFVDGVRTPAKRTRQTTPSEGSYDAYWQKTVVFAPNQRRRVRVETRAPYGGSVNWGMNRALEYHFTGGNWRGNVAQSDLEVRVSQPGLWTAIMTDDKGALPFTLTAKPRLAVLKHSWRNWEAEKHVTVGLERVVPFWLVDADQVKGNDFTAQSFRNAKTFRIGGQAGNSNQLSGSGAPPQGFVKNGVAYISAFHFEQKLRDLNDARPKNARLTISSRWSSNENSWRLFAGPHGISVRAGSPKLTSNLGEALRTLQIAPPLKLGSGQSATLYLPLQDVAKSLGLLASSDVKARTYTIQKGTWPMSYLK
jgi:hypothetical protein